jgi:hypothetical protein
MIELLEAAKNIKNSRIWDQLRHSAEELWLKSSESLRQSEAENFQPEG